jgi:hypothetical protein
MDTSGAKIWLPGVSDPDTLDAASRLCGTTAMRETRPFFGRDAYPDYYARQPVMTPDMIRQLPARHALIVRGGMSPVIGRLPMAWNDRQYRHARRVGQTAARLALADELADLLTDTPPAPPGQATGPAVPPPDPWDDHPGSYPWQ